MLDADSISEVDEQVGRIRRRLNWSLIQDRIIYTLAVWFLVASVLAFSATRFSPSTFNFCLGASVLAAGGAMVFGVLSTLHNWLSSEETVRVIDTRAALEDRMAALLLHRHDLSSLASVVLIQVQERRNQWSPQTIAPVQPRRSIYTLIGAVATFMATMYLERSPLPPPQTHVASSPQRDTDPIRPNSHSSRMDQKEATRGGGSGKALPEELEPESSSNADPSHGVPLDQQSAYEGGAISAADAVADHRQRPSDLNSLGPRIQQMIRTSLGRAVDSPASLIRSTSSKLQPRGNEVARASPLRGAQLNASHRPGTEGSGDYDHAKSQRIDLAALRSSTSHGNAAGGGPGGTASAGDPYGKSPHLTSFAERKRFPLQLSGSSRVMRLQLDRPIERPRDNPGVHSSAETRKTSEIDLDDVALHRIEIDPKLESTLRQIYITRAFP